MRYRGLLKVGMLCFAVITALPVHAQSASNTSSNTPSLTTGVNGLKRIFKLINIYRGKHGGAYPLSTSALAVEMLKRPHDYALKDTRAAMSVFTSPYSVYVDKAKIQGRLKGGGTPYTLVGKRSDGKLVGSPKQKGTRDILAYTYGNLNYHAAAAIPYGRASNPAGFYLVLWNDGKVEKIRQDRVLYVPGKNTDYFTAFRVASRCSG